VIHSQFESTVKRALEPYVEPEDNDEPSMDDGYKAFRTNPESLIAIVHAWFIIIFRLHIWLQRSLHRRFKLTIAT
jgi:hypothetical protein